ncbi:MAG: hypothetical protein BWY78_00935 [Alphaproteobacteria bacterium ADurb.Bin438]|nr:MAG: hypothetical protein BWY78_00935 [Alphaproteobacteria bacterium ADurb.Bin438]
MSDKNKTLDFVKNKTVKHFENGLAGIRKTLSPLVYDDYMVEKTKLKIMGIATLASIGIGLAIGIKHSYPKEEAISNISKAINIGFGAFGGFVGGIFAGSLGEKGIDGDFKNDKMSKLSLAKALNKIDVYLYKNNPELYEKTEKQIEQKVANIKQKDLDKQNAYEQKEALREQKRQQKELNKQNNQKIIEMQNKRRNSSSK